MFLTKDFPSSSERAEILAQREQMLEQMGPILAQLSPGQKSVVERDLADLARKYQPADVAAATKHVLSRIRRNQADMGCTHAQQDVNLAKIPTPEDVR